MAYQEHVRGASASVVRCAVITLSDTRTPETDTSGGAIRSLLEADGQVVTRYILLPDDPGRLSAELLASLESPDCDAIVTNGGTGVSPRDTTVSVVEGRIVQPLPGFGELFRMLSWEQIGSGAMLSRAVAGIARAGKAGPLKPVFCLPGSTKAVELGMSRLILPELRHLIAELRKR